MATMSPAVQRIHRTPTQSPSFLFLCLVIIINSMVLVASFNLDPRIPVIKRGTTGTYFGYSVAEHIILSPRKESRILVGAPRAQSGQRGTNHSGAIFDCPLTMWADDCNRLPIDDEGDVMDDEMKDDQWLGVTLKSQGPGGFVVACAHRYIKKGKEYRWGNGICYSLTQNLDQDNVFDPCLNRPVEKAHEQFGYCQAGTSGAITEDNKIVIGTPGPYTWRGTVFINSVAQGVRDDIAWYMGPVSDASAPVDKYSYLGMSVTSGRYIDKTMTFVAGAPRANNTGQVVFFTKAFGDNTLRVRMTLNGEVFASSFGYEVASADLNGDGLPDLIVGAPFYYDDNAGGAIYVYKNSFSGIKSNSVPVKITGKPESRFGFAIANCSDLNKDGYEDIAVGAPYEGNGVVYIFMGSSSGIKEEPVQIIRSESLDSIRPIRTFGHSLSGGLDLDNNKYPDLMVGAYENDAAILLRARPIISIETTVTHDSNISPTTKGCRHDRHSDQTCLSFNTCFKITSKEELKTDVISINYTIEADTFQGRKVSRVYFQGPNVNPDHRHIINKTFSRTGYQILQDYCQNETFYLRDNVADILSPVPFKLTYSLIHKPILPARRQGQLPDINEYPILNQEKAVRIFHINFNKSCGKDDVCQSDLKIQADFKHNTQILSVGEMQNVTLRIKISNKNEPAYEAAVYIKHPESLSYIQGIAKTDKENPCQPVDKMVKCALDNPFIHQLTDTVITVAFSALKVKDTEQELYFTVTANTTSDLPEKVEKVLKLSIVRKAELQFLGITRPDQVKYGGEVKGQSAMKHENDVGTFVEQNHTIWNYGFAPVPSLTMTFQWPYEIENHREHGKWLLYLTHEPIIYNTYGTCNINPSRVNSLNLTLNEIVITPPIGRAATIGSEEYDKTMDILTEEKSSHEKTTTYEETHTRTKTTHTRTETRTETRSSETSSSGFRSKREADPRSASHTSSKKTIRFHCGKTAKCFTFDCVIHNLRPNTNVTVTLRARLWNSTFVSEYPFERIDSVEMTTIVDIKLDSVPKINLVKDFNPRQEVVTYAFPEIMHSQKTAAEIPYWVYIIAALAGLLILVLVVVGLWKCGFFERKRPEAMMKGNLEKNEDYHYRN